MQKGLFAAVILGITVSPPTFAQTDDFPNKPIKIVVPVPAGGAADTLARVVGKSLQSQWGQPVIVENRAGAGGNIGADLVFKSEPDGHTLLLSPPGAIAINKALYKNLTYDQDKFVPVSIIAANPNVLLVHPKVPVKTLDELIAYAKANPGKLNYASGGAGSTTHLAGEMLKQKAGIDIVHIPYKGGPPAYADLLGAQVEIMFQGLVTALPQIRDGSLRVLAVGSEKRHPELPNVPTLVESIPGFVTVSWSGLVAPPGTSPAIAEKISTAISTDLRKQSEGGQELKGLDARDLLMNTPAEAAEFIAQEKRRWSSVIETTGISLD